MRLLKTRLATLALLQTVCFAQFRAGAGKQIITPDAENGPVYLAGFGQNRAATGVHDDLFARCIALSAGRTLVICGVDSIGFFSEDVDKIRDQANDHLPRPADIVIAATNDHAAPDTLGFWGPAQGKSGVNEIYNLFVIDRVAEAVIEAVHSLRPATLKLASAANAELESFLNDARPPKALDAELTAFSAIDQNGKTIATLVNWANPPATLGAANTKLTADYPGFFYTALEKRVGGLAIFVNGAIGGIEPAPGKPIPEESFRKAELVGTRIAELAANALRSAKRETPSSIVYHDTALEIPLTNPAFGAASAAGAFQHRKSILASGAVRTTVGMFRIATSRGPLFEAALIPGRLFPELSIGGIEHYFGADHPGAAAEPPIKKMMTAPFHMLIGLANDEIGDIIPESEWDEKAPWLEDAPKAWYGEADSVGPEAAPLIAAAATALFTQPPSAKQEQ